MISPRFSRLAPIAFSLALAACGAGREAGAPEFCVLDPPARIGGPISLVNQDGQAVTEAAFAGRPALIYFGFTYCPDVCPLSLQAADAALSRLGETGASVQPVLISVDPERDTPAAMKTYVESDAFPEGTVGLTGSLPQIEQTAKVFAVYRAKVERPGSSDYLIDHSSFFYLMSPDWRVLAMYPSDLERMPVAAQAACIEAGLARAT